MTFFLISLAGQMLSGVLMAVGLVLGLRWAMPYLARALRDELQRGPGADVQADEGAPQVRPDREPDGWAGRKDYLSGGR